MMSNLTALRDALKNITGISSCKVGLEDNISPADYPLARIVPTRITPGRPYHNRTAECQIIAGCKIANSEGLEAVYTALFTFEAEILRVIKAQSGRYIDTLWDEDRLSTYKLIAIRCEIGGALTAPPAPAPAPP